MAKLTLSVDERIVSRAKQYAKRRGTSVSAIVEAYLAAVVDTPSGKGTPVLRMVQAILKEGDTADYKRHLTAKYR